MLIGAIDPKVASGLILRDDLGTHPRIIGLQTTILKAWPILADGCIESSSFIAMQRVTLYLVFHYP